MKLKSILFAVFLTSLPLFAQQPATPRSTEPEPASRAQQMEREQQQPTREREPERTPAPATPGGPTSTNFHFDMKETAPSVTHHQVTVGGRSLRYTATAGRMPVKNGEGTTEALMFYVAYTLDGADAAAARKYENPEGDIQAFGEFIRMYISRNER
ncbi:MAG TPA: hypothetical protein VI670_02095, partial [Thermoanaerobaculia bacterium]